MVVTMITGVSALYALYEVDSDAIETLSRAVYQNTPQGVSVALLAPPDDGVKLSTIVEGTDAEWSLVLEFPFSEEDWYGALEAAETWADEVRDEDPGPLEYTLTEDETLLMIRALAYYGDSGLEEQRDDPINSEDIELFLQNSVVVTIAYTDPTRE